jgi:hypothetical protein
VPATDTGEPDDCVRLALALAAGELDDSEMVLEAMRRRGVLVVGALSLLAVAGCSMFPFSQIAQIDHARSQMVAAAKAKGLIAVDWPADCVRAQEGRAWGTLDKGDVPKAAGPCANTSKLLIVLRRTRDGWRVVGSTSAFPSAAGCRISGVPTAVAQAIPYCYRLP